ncbi:MAG TPA: hypothetical protein VK889_01960 [Solirubrobacterales bacterium]|nr:hypothetical protein [Solirubrobacterales bacterium]
MSILDDAIREHLELKRQHGAPDDELKKLEDEAFGPPARPDEPGDPLAEAPTEFMTTPDSLPAESAAFAAEEPATEIAEPEGRRVPDIADLQEAPPAPAPAEDAPVDAELEPPAEEPHPAMEHEAIPEPPPAPPEPEASHTTEERHAIAEQPTEMFDVEGELAGDTAASEEPPVADSPAPSDEELVDSELEEPRLTGDAPPADAFAPPSPPAEPAPAPAFDDEDDFFDEQRLSDELDQALEAPQPAAAPAPAEPEATEEHPLPPVEEPVSEEHEQPSAEHSVFEPQEEGHEDVLEDTPDFLEEAPEDDQLWFEQKPPKDFDFDD